MSKKNDRTIYKDGNIWKNKKNSSKRASSIHDTQQEAIENARKMLMNQGGGELIVKSTNGKIRSKDTISPGNDPNPPIDKEH